MKYIRLNSLAARIVFVASTLEERKGIQALTEVTEEEVGWLFNAMRTGEVTRIDGRRYQSTSYYAEVFKSFWRWLILVQKKAGK